MTPAASGEIKAVDPRVDRAGQWALGVVTTVALLVGGYFFNSMEGAVDDLKTTVQSLTREVTVLSTSQATIADHESRLRALESATVAGFAPHEVRIRALEQKVLRRD